MKTFRQQLKESALAHAIQIVVKKKRSRNNAINVKTGKYSQTDQNNFLNYLKSLIK